MIPCAHTCGMRTVLLGMVLAVCAGLNADTARAQQVLVASPPPDGTDVNFSESRQRIGANHNLLIGHVEIRRPDFQIFADQVELFTDQDRAIATGNVVLSQGNNRIAADHADFNTKTKLGTFYNAWGTAQMAQPKTKPTANPAAALPPGLPGNVAPATAIPAAPTTIADTDIYFFGETIEKMGARKFKISSIPTKTEAAPGAVRRNARSHSISNPEGVGANVNRFSAGQSALSSEASVAPVCETSTMRYFPPASAASSSNRTAAQS